MDKLIKKLEELINKECHIDVRYGHEAVQEIINRRSLAEVMIQLIKDHTADKVLVPIEPTEEMQVAGASSIRIETTDINKIWTANKVYKAMIATYTGEG